MNTESTEATTTDRGTYLEVDGRPAVRFRRRYAQSPERVWSALTDPVELPRWFPSRVEMEYRVGGGVFFSGDPNAEPTTGEVLVFDPPRRLSFTWGGNELRFELVDVDGECVLTLTDLLDQKTAAARNAAGWSVCLGELDKLMAGRPADGPASETSADWRPLYEEYVAAGLPDGAELPHG